jgi:hypothetical protein
MRLSLPINGLGHIPDAAEAAATAAGLRLAAVVDD